MDFAKNLIEFLSDKDFSVPLAQVIVFVIINSFCLLFGRHKMGLLISYCFVFYWGFIFNRQYFINILGQTSMGLPIYIFAGFVMFVSVILGFFHHKD